jgi:hypothetical protein
VLEVTRALGEKETEVGPVFNKVVRESLKEKVMPM